MRQALLPLSLPASGLTPTFLDALATSLAAASELPWAQVAAVPAPAALMASSVSTGPSSALVLVFPSPSLGNASLPVAWPPACAAMGSAEPCGPDAVTAVRP